MAWQDFSKGLEKDMVERQRVHFAQPRAVGRGLGRQKRNNQGSAEDGWVTGQLSPGDHRGFGAGALLQRLGEGPRSLGDASCLRGEGMPPSQGTAQH